ncbi:MAG: acyl-CoA thioesterase [Planctomycetes bacterium]|nr:acyl-CoA thioesterase [Planctomycetota bacterium]
MSAKDELFRTFPVIVTQTVLWGEMDSYQHVNNVAYFRYFENGRLEYVRRAGWFEIEKATGIGPILASTQARFRRAIKYPDTIHIGTRLLEMKDDRFTIEHKIVSEALDDIATTGEGLVVSFHYASGKKVALPDNLKEQIRALEATVNNTKS